MSTPFPVEVLPEPLRSYVEEGSDALGCNIAYIAVPALPVVASTIGNTPRIRLKHDWTEPPVVWSAMVGEFGTAKSPARDLMLAPLWPRQNALLEEYALAH